jgi:hypothetical protein
MYFSRKRTNLINEEVRIFISLARELMEQKTGFVKFTGKRTNLANGGMCRTACFSVAREFIYQKPGFVKTHVWLSGVN